MIVKLLAFMEMDLRVHTRYFLGIFGFVVCVVILGPSLFQMSKAHVAAYLITYAAIATPIIVPWWIVGNDRTTGAMWLVASLPIERAEIVLLKTIETLIWSFASMCACAIGIVFLGAQHVWSELYPVVIPTAFAASFVSTAAYFLFPSRIAMFVVFGGFFLFTRFAKPLQPLLSTQGMPVIIGASTLIAACMAAIAYFIATNVFSKRASPCE